MCGVRCDPVEVAEEIGWWLEAGKEKDTARPWKNDPRGSESCNDRGFPRRTSGDASV